MDSLFSTLETILFHIRYSLAGIYKPYGESTIVFKGRKLIAKKKLGEGGFGVVYLVRDLSSKRFYALKRMKLVDKEMENAFNQEVQSHMSISHPNVLKLLDYEVRQFGHLREGITLMPLYQNGTLLDLINKHAEKKSRIPFPQMLAIFKSICNGLVAFHNPDMNSKKAVLAFRDLKPANVLLEDNCQTAVLTDLAGVVPGRFVISSRSEALALQELAAQQVTPLIRPPELFTVPSTENFQFDERTDIWSLGCILYQMCFLTNAFDGTESSALGRIEIPPTGFVSDGVGEEVKKLWGLIPWLLNVELGKRPFLKEVQEKIQKIEKETGLGSTVVDVAG
ncbi:kinase-like domain-containing protein [Paraphysoderma sedebokerense]|nr:kinase-like domain-containing protein [Paraphysoderma sedebokerense]